MNTISTPFPSRRRLDDVDDGIITGRQETKGTACDHCGVHTRVIRLHSLTIPKQWYDDNGLLARLIFLDDNLSMISRIGIGCGCYARGHRQIAHIRQRRGEQ